MTTRAQHGRGTVRTVRDRSGNLLGYQPLLPRELSLAPDGVDHSRYQERVGRPCSTREAAEQLLRVEVAARRSGKTRIVGIREANRPLPKGPLLYVIGGPRGVVKIGVSSAVKKRLATMQTNCPQKLRVFAVSTELATREKYVHELFKFERSNGEWFRFSKRLEGFVMALVALELRNELVGMR